MLKAVYLCLFMPGPMISNILKSIYLKICISKYFSRLDGLNNIYVNGDHEEYVRRMAILYADLLQLPPIVSARIQAIPSGHRPAVAEISASEDPIVGIFSGHSALLSKTEAAIDAGKADDLYELSPPLTRLLDEIYVATSLRKQTPRQRFVIPGAALLIFLLLVAGLYSPLKGKYLREKERYDLQVNGEAFKEKTLSDILALKQALQKYYADHHSYPKSSGGFDAIRASYGESRKDWIPGLAPAYVKSLPVDPRESKDPGEQYMYKSDGKDFKLIAHNPSGIEEIIHNRPDLADPARPSWAFGAWSEGAKNW